MGLFSGLLGGLLGGGGGGDAGGVQYTPPTTGFGVLPNAANMMGSYTPLPPPSGVAGFTPNQQQSWQTGLAGAQQGVGAANQALGLANQYGGNFQGYLGSAGGINPMTGQLIQQGNQLLGRNYAQSVLPTIRAGAQGAGQFGSTRHGIAEGIGRQGLGDAMQRQTTELLSNAWNQGQLNQRAAWGMAPEMARLQMGAQYYPAEALANLAQTQGGIGAQQQALNQQRLQEQRGDFANLRQEPYDRLTWYNNIVNSNAGLGGSSSMPNPNQQNPLLAGLGTGMATYDFLQQLPYFNPVSGYGSNPSYTSGFDAGFGSTGAF